MPAIIDRAGPNFNVDEADGVVEGTTTVVSDESTVFPAHDHLEL
jgi:hypothetical protein